MSKENNHKTGLEIAVIGMAGRFPGAGDIHEFWENLKSGIESIAFFSPRDLEKGGADAPLPENPDYVKANGILAGIDYFDASFFAYSPREADIMDPQMRVFHECAWHALEDAAYCSDTYGGLIGLYAGASSHFNWEARVILSGKVNDLGHFGALQLRNKDFLSLRISYRLNLKGPAVIVQTACSTSLVAIHMACQAILNGECDMALAGGVTIVSLEKSGYLYREGMINSPDGHCRAFDARAKGTVAGDGIGIVVLKRLEEAIAHNDHIYAVVKGSAVNNDGVRKIGFTAPSIEGEAEVIMTAQEMAEVEPGSIAYIEAHGTATGLGDPVEIGALKLAFASEKKGYCAVGSVKTNVGHLNDAAGVAGFIKAVLSLYHRLIPPSLHFETANPEIDFENSPFYVNTGLKEWKKEAYPRRAGVSSFGIGGTNAHVILEEGPGGPSSNAERMAQGAGRPQLILISAKTEHVLEKMTVNLGKHLKHNPHIDLRDAAYTLQVGRKALKCRQMLVCGSVDEAVETMSSPDAGKPHTHVRQNEEQTPAVIFMFPGQGAQYVNMGLELYRKEPVFQEEMNLCFKILKSLTSHDLKEILYPPAHIPPQTKVLRGAGAVFQKSPCPPEARINQTQIVQPLLFSFEYALAKLLTRWGIKPYAMTGHSIGEYVAACLSGVFSLEDALRLVVLRGQSMQQMPGGAMLSVPLAEDRLLPLLETDKRISLAAVNSSSLCTVSGPAAAIDDFERRLKEKGSGGRRLHTSHAFHSAAMDPIVETFAREVGQISLNKPEIPYISNLTGNWITVGQAVDPAYWASHLRQTVRFAHGLGQLLKKEDAVFIEVGPGNVLSTFVRKHEDKGPRHFIVNLIKHPRENLSDHSFLLTQAGRLWLYDVPIDWREFHGEEQPHRIPLPTYPFEKKRYPFGGAFPAMVEQTLSRGVLKGRKKDMADWFYVPQWTRSTLAPAHRPGKKPAASPWLVLMDDHGLGDRLVKALAGETPRLIVVKKGGAFAKLNAGEYTLAPGEKGHYEALFQGLQAAGTIPGKIIHLWNITGNKSSGAGALTLESLEETQDIGFYGLLLLARTIGELNSAQAFSLDVITDNMHEVVGGEGQCPQKALVLGPVRVIPVEYPNIRCRSIDIDFPGSTAQLLQELTAESPEPVIALRGNFRWRQTFEPVRLEKPRHVPPLLKEKGVYLVTGGLGGIGLTLAEHLVRTLRARVILTGRSASTAPPGQWQQRKPGELEAPGGDVSVFKADAANEEQMQTVIEQTLKRFGRIDGVIHAAGSADGGLIRQRTRENSDPVLAPKVKGTLVLDNLLKDQPLDFFLLCSSLSSFLGPFGQVAYCSANAFLDAFTHYRNSRARGAVRCINWDAWQQVGMAVEAVKQLAKDPHILLKDGISPAEGLDIFHRILENPLPQVAVSVKDFSMISMAERRAYKRDKGTEGEIPLQQRPGLSTKYIEPEDELELTLAGIFRDFLGIERVGSNDNFFELGLSSLDLVHIAGKLKEELEKEVPVAAMFTHSTVRALARYVREPEERPGDAAAEDKDENEPGEHLENAIDLLTWGGPDEETSKG